jgi:hypothetical protein
VGQRERYDPQHQDRRQPASCRRSTRARSG